MKNKDYFFSIWKNIFKIRYVEQTIANEYHKGEMRCPTHLSIGQEAVPSVLNEFLKKTDHVVSGHRAHAHYLAKGGNLKKMLSEIFGKENGCAQGRGGSMHLIDRSVGFAGSTAIVANSIPVGVGIAFAKKLKNTKDIVIIYLGDGAIEEGAFYESINFAILKKLPVFFVCENNFYSVYTPMKYRQPKNRKIHKMVEGLGCKTFAANGNDPYQMYNKISVAIKKIRSGAGPIFGEFYTYRHREHCGPNFDDNLNYRPKKELEYWLKKDPLLFLENKINKSKKIISLINDEKKKIKHQVNQAFKFARKSKYPINKLTINDVYAKKN
jgi:TPP-dependent pyruvate/acetoin dehydrogenase alpha subunit